ncbi:MAG: DUF5615 family PIN-like protein [Acidobacteriota bacterium]
MNEVCLHLDADTSSKALHRALLALGHDVTRTPCEWIEREASDEAQLLRATAQGRAIFTFNIRDFSVLARLHPQHRGIVLAAQASWTLGELIDALSLLIKTMRPETLNGQIVWLPRGRST